MAKARMRKAVQFNRLINNQVRSVWYLILYQRLIVSGQPFGLHKNSTKNSKNSKKHLRSQVFFNVNFHVSQHMTI